MELLGLVLVLIVVAAAIHLARFWARLAFVVTTLGAALLIWMVANASTNTLDVLGLTFALDLAARDFLTLALALTAALGIATTFQAERTSIGFLFWSWPLWLAALAVNNFTVAVLAWTMGLVAVVLAMQPRRLERTGGAAYFLVLIVVATASLLIANRFIELYPLTPERTVLIQGAVLFLTLGLGILLALAPFHLWLGPMADEASLPIITAILGFGQPIGLWLLLRLIGQYPRLVERSDLLTLMAVGGAVAILVGGLLALSERRAGRLLAYAAMSSLGFVLLDLSQGTGEALAYAGLEILSRAVALTLFAVSVTVGSALASPWARRLAVIGFVLAGLNLAGLRIGVGLAERWSLVVQLAASGTPIFWLLVLSQLGLLVGIVRFAGEWLREIEPVMDSDKMAEPEPLMLEAAAMPILPSNGAESNGREPAAEKDEELAVLEVPEYGASEAKGPLAGQDEEERPAKTGRQLRPLQLAEAHQSQGSPRRASNKKAEDEVQVYGDVETDEEYVFEAHLGQIFSGFARRSRRLASRIIAPMRPPLRRLFRSLPLGARRFLRAIAQALLATFRSWRTWTSIGLVLGLLGLLFLTGLVPGLILQRALTSLGQSPFAR